MSARSMASSNFKRLIRFRNPAGQIYYGEADGMGSTLEMLRGQTVPVYKGHNPWDDDFNLSLDRDEVAEVSHFGVMKRPEDSCSSTD